MIKLVGVNPFAEAMLYYWGKANDEQIERRLPEVIKRHPEYRETLEKTTNPAATLEKLLDSKLTVNEILVDKYFKKFDSFAPRPQFSFCLAFIMVYFQVISHIDYSPNEMCKYLRECSMEDRMYALCFGIIGKYENLINDGTGIEEFTQHVEDLQISTDNKWKILNAGIRYGTHLEELLSLIMPAAKLIQEALSEHSIIEEDFHKLYYNNNAQTLFKFYFDFNIERIDIMYVAPMIFKFDNAFAVISLNNNDTGENAANIALPVTGSMFVGIARHLINNSPQNDIPALCEKLKAISDNTRLEMLFYLCFHKAYIQELCNKFKLQHSTISYHITKLLDAGFLAGELIGGKTYYSADKEGIQRMLDAFAEKIK